MLANVLLKRDGRSVMEIQRLPDPCPGPGQVLLEVRAAALNHLDLFTRDRLAAEAAPSPHILGSDAAGVVREIGTGVANVRVGDKVVLNPGLSCGRCEPCSRGEHSQCLDYDIVGRTSPGTFAELVLVPAENLAPKLEHLSFDQAAALPLAHLTAWRMLVTRGQLRSGETVLIHGIGGGVALACLQIAKAHGAAVFVTSSSRDKLDSARQLGADQALDYAADQDLSGTVRELTGGRGADLVIDTVGAATIATSISAARNGGRVVVCGATTGPTATVNLREIFWRQISVLGSTMGSREDFRAMLAAVAANRLVPTLDSTHHLSQAGEALARLESGAQLGKIVLSSTAVAGCWPSTA
jgi:NADPH:quinone reductase-like Zn-dependent oxidoreductase